MARDEIFEKPMEPLSSILLVEPPIHETLDRVLRIPSSA